ncbi:MAG TPA: hypothetical protein VHA80_09105 [Solirubrobacterales bacterium]|nr:hypothetical protein [Solirubrobacterales bacterium]
MTPEAPFSVQAALVRHFEREVGSQLGMTLRALTRSDRDRLTFWDGDRIVDDFHVQRKYIDGRDQQVVIEAAQLDGTLTPCVGYLYVPNSRPVEGAWLLTADGDVIDPARRLRQVEGLYGIALRATEAANWTP